MSVHHILPGSLELEDVTVTAGIHIGSHELDVQALRFVTGNLSHGLSDDTLISYLGRVYDNSTGCLINGDFKPNEGDQHAR